MSGSHQGRSTGRTIPFVLLAWLVLGSAGAAIAAEMRTWSDRSGKYQIKAKLLEVKDGKALLQRENGGKLQIELDKLSKADQQYLEENGSDAANPFQAVEEDAANDRDGAQEQMGDEEETEAAAKFVKVRWTGVRTVAPPASGDWQLSIEPPSDAGPVRRRAISLPGKKESGEWPQGMVVNSTCLRAVVGYTCDRTRSGNVTRLILCDIQGGRAASGGVSGRMVPLALSDSGDQVLMRPEEHGSGTDQAVELWTLTRSGVQRGIQWIVDEDVHGNTRQARWAAFLDEERLATLSDGGRLVVWKLDPLRPMYCLQVDGGCVPALSPDRKYLAVAGNKQLGVLDLKAGKVVAAKAVEDLHWPTLSFSPSGKRLACAAFDKLYVWEAATGALYREILLTGATAGGHCDWTSEEHILVGHRTLIDVENQIKLWAYLGHDAVACLGGVCWFVTNDRSTGAGVLVPLRLPHPTLKEGLEKAMKDPNFFVLKPGVTVRLVVDALSDPAAREKARAALAARLQGNGCQVGPNGTIDLVASVDPPKQTEVSYHTFGSFGAKTYKFQEYFVRLKFVHQGQCVWESACSSNPGFMIHLKEGETVEQRLRESEKPNYGWFTTVELPKIAVKASQGGTLGQSWVTPNGLEDIPVPKQAAGMGGGSSSPP